MGILTVESIPELRNFDVQFPTSKHLICAHGFAISSPGAIVFYVWRHNPEGEIERFNKEAYTDWISVKERL